MNVHAIRLRNLLLLKEIAGTVTRLADRIGTSPNYISQILGDSRTREIGHSLARRCEQAFDKPEGWMDHLHDPLVEEIEELFLNAPEMTHAQREVIRAQLAAVRLMIKSFLQDDPVSLRN